MTRLITLFFATGCILTGANYIIKPIFNKFVNYFLENGHLSLELPFKAKHFNDDMSNLAFILTYFVQACYTYFVVTVSVSSKLILN